MNYCIFSIDDRRKHYTDRIRSTLSESFWFKEQPVKTCNANDPDDLRWSGFDHRRFPIRWREDEPGPKKGHLGIWYSVLNALEPEYTPIVTFEDDAILDRGFLRMFWDITDKLPADTDAFSLFLPRDQDAVYHKIASQLTVSLGICRAYQRYGGVSMFWTPKGAAKFKSLVHLDGINDQWDNQLYKYAQSGQMNVYTQPPNAVGLVTISGREESIVQETGLA